MVNFFMYITQSLENI